MTATKQRAAPDFLIIGAMKSGTSTLQAQLAAQPAIFMTQPKEPNFFSDDPIYAKGLDWYRSLYDPAEPGQLCGEASTHYTKLPTYPETVTRLAKVAPAPRLIYMIRNPVERAVSHYVHEWSEGRMPRDPAAAFAAHDELVAYSRYPMQLAPFIAQFGRDAILLTSLEQVRADPEGELTRIGTHLGLKDDLHWDHDMGAQNVSRDRARKMPFHSILIGNPIARQMRRLLVPKSVRTRVRQARIVGEKPEVSPELRQNLQVQFTSDRAELESIFPGHPALGLCYPFADK